MSNNRELADLTGETGDQDRSFGSIDTQRASNTSLDPDREMWTTGDTTVNVPADYDTIQAAIDDIPRFVNHDYTITVDDGDYSAEDILVPPISRRRFAANDQSESQVLIEGNGTTPSNVDIGSISVQGFDGGVCRIKGFAPKNENPYDNEPDSVVAYFCHGKVAFQDMVFESDATITNGILSYNSHIEVRSVDFGTDVLTGEGIRAKQSGTFHEQPTNGDSGIDNQGNVGGYAYQASGNSCMGFIRDESTLTGDLGLASPNGGPIYKSSSGFAHGISVDGDLNIKGSQLQNLGSLTLESDNTAAIKDNGGGNAVILRLDGSANTYEFFDSNGNKICNLRNDGTVEVPNGGPNGTGEIAFANTRMFEDANGEIVVEDSAGNQTTIS